MRGYLVPILALSFLASLANYILPSGALRRFVSPLLSLAVAAAILLPVLSFAGGEHTADFLLPVLSALPEEEVYRENVENTYKTKICSLLASQGAVAEEILLDEDFRIRGIVLQEEPPLNAMLYITTKLEVSRSDVQIR